MITQQLSFRDDEAMRIKLRRRPLPDYLTVLENYGPRKRGMRSVVRVFNASRKMSAEGDEAAAASASEATPSAEAQPVQPLVHACEDSWTWDTKQRSHEVRLSGPRQRIAHFHPNWSNGTAGVRGTRRLNGGRFC